MSKPVSKEALERGQRIRALRESQGYSMEQLAALIGVQRAAIHKWENGMVEDMGGVNLINLADALRAPPANILWGKDGKPPPPKADPPSSPGESTGRFRRLRSR